MNFVIKISDDYINTQYQVINPEGLFWTKELKSTGRMEFLMHLDDDQIGGLVQYKKIALYMVDDGVDTLLWSGYISDFDINFETVMVKCYDEKKFMEEKILFADKSWSGTALSNVLSTLTTEANTRSGGVKGDLSYDTDISDTVTKDYNKGTKYYIILNEIADLLGGEWDVVLNEIQIYETIGIDRTVAGNDFIEFVSNIDAPIENTITEYRQVRSGRDIKTSVMGKVSSSTTTANANTDEFGHVEGVQSFSGDQSLSDQTAAFLAESSVSQGYTEIKIDPAAIDFSKTNVGDLVSVRVERNNALLDVNEDVKILAKDVRLIDNVPQTSLKFGEIKKPIPSPQNFMKNLRSDIDILKLQ